MDAKRVGPWFTGRSHLYAAALASAALGAIPARGGTGAAGSAYKREAGPYAVETLAPVTLRDAARAKEIRVTVFAPRGGGRFPVVVFSHGAGGSAAGYAP